MPYAPPFFDVLCSLAKMKADPNFSAASSRSELEKLVGRRINPGVSLAEQQERFPFLKDAPVEHAYAAGVKVRACIRGVFVAFAGHITTAASRPYYVLPKYERPMKQMPIPYDDPSLSPTNLLNA